LYSLFDLDQRKVLLGLKTDLPLTGLRSLESSEHSRSIRNITPVFKFDYKSGVYINDLAVEKHRHLATTYSYAAKTGRVKSQWFFSDDFNDFFFDYINSLLVSINKDMPTSLNSSFLNKNHYNSHFDVYLYLYNLFSHDSGFLNFKRLSLNSLNQKFESMFLSNTAQQRVYNN
jgi:hypothetical protein